jgi:hypothetical protein
MEARSWLRVGVLLLGVGDVAIGAWAYLLPHTFYNNVPTVAMDPPFSQHFVTDVGAFFVAQGVVMVAAAIIMEYRLVCVALAGYLTFAILPTRDAIGLVIALALDVAFPVVLLIVARYLAIRPQAESVNGLPE